MYHFDNDVLLAQIYIASGFMKLNYYLYLVSMFNVASGRHSRLVVVSLALLAAVLLIVDISLGVHCKSVFVNVPLIHQLITYILYHRNFQEIKLMSDVKRLHL